MANEDDASSQSMATRHRLLTMATACLPPALYLFFVEHFTSDGLLNDDWNLTPFVHSAIHGNFSWGEVWSQYGETRLPLVRLEYLVFAKVAGLDTRWMVLFSATLLIAGYGFLLALFRRYRGGLTPLSVLAIGAVWFSLADVQSALWSFEVGWFLVLFGFVAMLFALLVPQNHRTLWLVIAILAATVSTLGAVQGFCAWPIGLAAILCQVKPTRRRTVELVVWVGTFVVLVMLYLVGYKTSITSCAAYFGCVPTDAATHPLGDLRFLVVLIGNVIPGTFTSGHPGILSAARPTSVVRYEVAGVVVLFGALYVLVRSWRRRAATIPLPALVIGFALLFDATITWGRVGETPAGAILSNRYVMPNLVLLVGVVMYALERPRGSRWAKTAVGVAAITALGVFVLIQVTVSTSVGIASARNIQADVNYEARLVVNLNQIPASERTCELVTHLISPTEREDVAQDQLAEFAPGPHDQYRLEGLPTSLTGCGVPSG